MGSFSIPIQCLLMVRSVFHLTLRAAEGFLRSLFHLLEWELPVPDYTTLCKRAKRLGVSLHRKAAGPLHLVLDSTGLKVFGEGEWKVRQHGYTKRRTWRKLHLSVDSETQEIQAVVLSEASLDDAGAVPGLLDQSTESVEQVGGDGAYDKRKVYEGCAARGIRRVAIPPRKDARIWQHGNCAAPPLVRDENLRRIRKAGRKRWKTRVGLSSAFPGRDCHVSVQDHLWFLSSGQEVTAAEGGSQGKVCRFESDDPLGNAG